jgi:hypothetical protein
LKTGIYSVLCAFITNAAIGACFVPFLLLGLKKVRQMNTFRFLGIYWFLNGLVNLRELKVLRAEAIREYLHRLSNFYDMIDMPLALLIFAVANRGMMRKRLILVLMGFVAGETLLIGQKGYAFSWPIVVGVGVALIVGLSIAGLWQYLKNMEHDRFENSMAYVHGAFLFAYGTYLIIYLLFYLRTSGTYSEADSSLLYYISLLLSAAITSAGMFSYGWRWTRPVSPRYSSSSS